MKRHLHRAASCFLICPQRLNYFARRYSNGIHLKRKYKEAKDFAPVSPGLTH